MKNRILFSAVGNTDPVRNDYEGPILHIVRMYKPSKVYLYISKELKENEDKKIYSNSIKQLDDSIEVVCYPKKEDEYVIDVHKFDMFYDKFLNIINEIIESEEGEYELLFNLSSGTPAMKATMMLVGITLDNSNIKLVQVSTPEGKSNAGKEHEDLDNAIPKELVENTMESIAMEECKNRCSDKELLQTKKLFLFNNIKKLLKKYDYSGLNDLIEENKLLFSENVYNLCKHVYNRYISNGKKAEEFARKISSKLYPVENAEEKIIIEKFNILKINRIRGEIQDWLLLAVPIIERIYMQILLEDGMNIYDLQNKKDGKIDKLKFAKEYNKEYIVVENEIKEYFNGYLLKRIIDIRISDNDILKDVRELDKIRTNRNNAAHTLKYIEEEELSIDFKGIESKIKKYIIRFKNINTINVNEALNIYDTINERIQQLVLDDIGK